MLYSRLMHLPADRVQRMQPKLRSIQKAATYVLALAIILVRVEVTFAGRIPLTFSLILSYGRYGFNSSGIIPAIDLALEHINRSDVLGEYELQYSTVKDSGCNRGQSLAAFFSDFLLEPDPVKIALIGCGCSVATEPVAEISHLWNISQISFASAVSTLSDRTRFRSYFRTISNFDLNVPALLSILNHYGWNRIAFLTQNVNLFNKFFTDFRTLLENLKTNTSDACCFSNANITVVNRRYSTNENPISAIGDIFDKDGNFRVFFVNSYSANARKVICEAAKRNLTYPRYAWIMFGWYPDNWWTNSVANNNVSCSDEQLELFIENARCVLIQYSPITDDVNGTTIAGISPKQFDEMYETRSLQLRYSILLASTFAYDAVWTLALALNRTQQGNFNVTEIGCDGMDGGLVPLEQFNYSNGVMGCVIRWSLEQTNFSGVSGHVNFDVNGTISQKGIWLMQYRRQFGIHAGIERVQFGYVDKNAGFAFTYEGREHDHTIFPDGIPPDGTPRKVIHTIRHGLLITYYFLAVAGVVFSVTCLGFNFAFRKRQIVQLTSPKLNYLIIAGSLLMYCSVFIQLLYTTDKTTVHIQCILHAWMYLLGYLMAFGTILAKMWRVYQIFHDSTPNKMVPRDWHLAVIVLLITSVAIPLMVGESASEFPVLIRDDENREGRTALGVHEKNYVWVCYEPGLPAFYCDLFIYLYLALLQVVGIILAFQTRKVKITVLNDSKFVAALVYISSIVFVVLAIVTFSLRGYINVSKATFSGGILLLATSFLILTFVPKMLKLYSDPHGKKIFDKSNPVTGMESSSKQPPVCSVGTQSEPETVLEEKEKRISELEKELNLSKNGEANALNAQE